MLRCFPACIRRMSMTRFALVTQTPPLESWRCSPGEKAERLGHLLSHLSFPRHLYAREITLSAMAQHKGHLNVQDISETVTDFKRDSLVGRLYRVQILLSHLALPCFLFTQPFAICDTRCVGVFPHLPIKAILQRTPISVLQCNSALTLFT